MHERIVDLLVFLMGELRSHGQFGDINVPALERKGYTDVEITTAFAWLFNTIEASGRDRARTDREASVRMLHPVELSVLRPDGYGYLLQCFELGLLGQEGVELVIERLMMSGIGEATTDDVKRVIASVLFETDRPEDGTYPVLGPKDSIH